MDARRIHIALATNDDRKAIYRLRHEVYARELGQHPENATGEIRDGLDRGNAYIVARTGGVLAGFISITPPRLGTYSLEKYLKRDEIPVVLDEGTYEARILTVLAEYRGTLAAPLLMYAAFRWVEAHGGTRIVAIGRREVCDLYAKAGLQSYGREFRSGQVHFTLMSATTHAIRARVAEPLVARLEAACVWDLNIPLRKPAECFHGGAFFDAVGDEFDRLERRSTIINADVLDAWFPPSPRVVAAIDEYLPWLLRTSPPTGCEGMVRAIARARGVDPSCILPGAGSSDLIFLALREWLTPRSRVLLPQPTYGEYAHVLEKVIGCHADRVVLRREENYDLDTSRLLQHGYDLIVIVNPNSPTGRHVPRVEMEAFLRCVPADTLVWIDETYVDYAGADESLEQFAVTRENVVVCKSMSKVYALSGARCAYLCASPHLLERLRAITPPWAVSLIGQVAAVAALQDPAYYAEQYRQTHKLREELQAMLRQDRQDCLSSTANFLLCHVHDPAAVVEQCRAQGLFIRHAANMGVPGAIRIAVKDRATNYRMIEIMQSLAPARRRPLPRADAASPRAHRSTARRTA